MLLREAHGCGVRVIEQYVRSDYDGFLAPVETHEIDEGTFTRLSDTESPRGVIAVCEMPEPGDLGTDGSDWFLVLHGLSDPGNAGTLVRSAEAAGVTGVVWVANGVDPWSPKVVRASAGAVFHVPMWSCGDLDWLARRGVRLIGTSSHHEVAGSSTSPMHAVDFSGRIGIVLGNEAHGLPVDALVDEWIRIDHAGRSESLNVAMAGTVLAMHAGHVRGNGSIDRAPIDRATEGTA